MKKKAITSVIFLFVFPFLLYGQERTPVQLSNTQFNVNILAPSLLLEKGLTDNNSVTFAIGLSPLNDNGEISINPFFRTSFRNYYPRKTVVKELRPNSGNYIGLVGGYYFGSIASTSDYTDVNQSNSYYVGALWGIQRNYQSGIHLGFSIGSGFGVGENMDLKLTGVGELELGFMIK